ncbi:transposase [Halocola ammonii]
MKNSDINNQILKSLSNEVNCKHAFRDARFRRGLPCKSCGNSEQYWLNSKESFQCKNCRYRTTLKSGTILQGSKMPVSYWFKSVYFINVYPRLSAYELQNLLNHKFYEPVWSLKKKVESVLTSDKAFISLGHRQYDLLRQISDILTTPKS